MKNISLLSSLLLSASIITAQAQPIPGPTPGGGGAVSSVFGRTGAVVKASGDYVVGDVTGAAPAASPTFTGTVTIPTPTTADNSTKAASTAYVQAQGFALLASPTFTGTPAAPTPTVGDNTTKLATTAYVLAAGFAPIANPTFTGSAAGPTPATSDNSTNLATTAFVNNQNFALSGTGAVITSNTTITATQFNKECKMITVNTASLTITMPSVATLQANGGCLEVNNPAFPFTLAPNASPDLIVGAAGAGSAGASLVIPAGFTRITTDGIHTLYAGNGYSGILGTIVSGNLAAGTGYLASNLAGLGTGVSTALAANVSGSGAICLASGSACSSAGSPGGSNTQFQYNNSSAFGGISTLIYDGATITNSKAGASSASAEMLTGTPFVGTGTTGTPLFYFNGGTAPTTWSTAGTYLGFNAVSGFTGNFLDFHVAGAASVGTLNSSGSLNLAGAITSSNNIQAGASFGLKFSSRGGLSSPTDGVYRFQNNAGSGMTALNFGGENSTNPRLLVDGNGLDMKNGDNSAWTFINMMFLKTQVLTFSTLPATPSAGWRAFISDQTATCAFGTTANGSGSNECPVWYNGANWIDG